MSKDQKVSGSNRVVVSLDKTLNPHLLPLRLTQVLKMAARSMKKEQAVPPVAVDLLKLSLKEGSFQLFWKNAIVDGMFKEHPGAT